MELLILAVSSFCASKRYRLFAFLQICWLVCWYVCESIHLSVCTFSLFSLFSLFPSFTFACHSTDLFPSFSYPACRVGIRGSIIHYNINNQNLRTCAQPQKRAMQSQLNLVFPPLNKNLRRKKKQKRSGKKRTTAR